MRDYSIKKSVVFSDFDETIIDIKTFKISGRLSSYLKSHTSLLSLVIVTSRGWDGLKPYAKALNLQVPQIVENGAKIIDPLTERVIYQSNLKKNQIIEIQNIAIKSKVKLDFSAGLKSYSDINLLDKIDEIGRISINIEKEKCHKITNELKKIKGLSIIHGSIQEEQDEVLIDITSKKVTKLEGIRKWMELNEEALDTIYVAGNGYPDIPAFKIKDYFPNVTTIAVQNAVNELKCEADIIIRPPEERGFYQFLSTKFTLRNESVTLSDKCGNFIYSNKEKIKANLMQLINSLQQTPQYIYSFIKTRD